MDSDQEKIVRLFSFIRDNISRIIPIGLVGTLHSLTSLSRDSYVLMSAW